WRDWSLPAGGQVTRTSGGVRVAYAFQDTGALLTFRPAEPTDGKLMPVVVSPDIARAAGGLGQETTLDIQDVSIGARIVGVASRMPTVPGDQGPFVLADAGWLSTAIDANAPGEGTPNEIWISAPHDRAAVASQLRSPPFSSLDVASRAEIARHLSGDPL